MFTRKKILSAYPNKIFSVLMRKNNLFANPFFILNVFWIWMYYFYANKA